MIKNQRFDRRFRFALAGLREALRRESSFRIQTGVGVAVLCLLSVLRPPPLWWVVFVLCIGLVLAFELVNTALEALLDRLHPAQHEEIRLAKDCAAGAVLVLSFVSVLVFGFYLWECFG